MPVFIFPDISLPDISVVPDPLRIMIAAGLTGLLVILRFDAERFSAAEYDDVDRWGRSPSLFRRLAWYTIGLGLIVLVSTAHPSAETDLYQGLGERLGAVILGLAYGAIGTSIAVGIALVRYHRVRFPPARAYPGAVLNALATAFVDEAVFRGMVFGFLIVAGMNPNLANLTQALLYALATRLGAPGRPWYMLVSALAIGLAGGWLVGVTGGIGAAFLGHAITRVAIFTTTGHAGLPKAKGTEAEEVEKRQRTPDGWHVLGTREQTRDR